MKKQILNIGKALNKAEQKQINGGGLHICHTLQGCNNICEYECRAFRVQTGTMQGYFCWLCADGNNHQ